MPRDKKIISDNTEVEEIAVPDEPLEVLAEIPAIALAALPAIIPGPGAKKALGVKEVIPFKWKLVATVGRTIVTLFKSVEREESDAQLERVQREAYYRDPQVLDVNAKIEQPKQPRMGKEEKRAAAAAEKRLKTSAAKTLSDGHAKKASKPTATVVSLKALKASAVTKSSKKSRASKTGKKTAKKK